MTINFKNRWTRETSAINFRHRFADNPQLAREHEELEYLLTQFQESIDDVVLKLTSIVVSAEDARHPDPTSLVHTGLRSVKAQSTVLTSEVCSFAYECLL